MVNLHTMIPFLLLPSALMQPQTKFEQSELDALQKEVSEVKALVKTLISQVQLARQEIGELKR
jgi:hypothetical protein